MDNFKKLLILLCIVMAACFMLIKRSLHLLEIHTEEFMNEKLWCVGFTLTYFRRGKITKKRDDTKLTEFLKFCSRYVKFSLH